MFISKSIHVAAEFRLNRHKCNNYLSDETTEYRNSRRINLSLKFSELGDYHSGKHAYQSNFMSLKTPGI